MNFSRKELAILQSVLNMPTWVESPETTDLLHRIQSELLSDGEKIHHNIGERAPILTGSADYGIRANVTKFISPGSLHDGDKTIQLEELHSGASIVASLASLKHIVAWAEEP